MLILVYIKNQTVQFQMPGRKKDMSKLIFMIKTDIPPYLLFQENKINLIESSKKIKYEVLKHSEVCY